MNAIDRFRAIRDGSLVWWSAEQDDELICVDVHDETADVRTFSFESAISGRFHYLPGQFLTFDFPVDGGSVNRCYTIASSPSRPDRISITVKRQRDGVVSPWLHDHLKPGQIVRAVGPMGDFTFVSSPAEKYLFLSGGSGVTPLMSMTRACQDIAPETNIQFIHFARSPADIIFRDELDLMARLMPNLRVTTVCETDSQPERWGGARGRVTANLLQLLVPDLAERSIFDCGPAPFMKAVRTSLASLAFDMKNYHEESFDFGTVIETLSPSEIADVADIQGFTVTFSKTGRSINVGTNQHVLTAARAAGMRLPSSCTKGMCGTCKSRLISGRVDMKHQGGIRQREIDQGMILICCSTPLTDLVIER